MVVQQAAHGHQYSSRGAAAAPGMDIRGAKAARCRCVIEQVFVTGSIPTTTKPTPSTPTAIKQYPAATNKDPVLRYLRMAATLSSKTARDVALRCKWMASNAKKRKATPALQPSKLAKTPSRPTPSKSVPKPALAPPVTATAPVPLDDHGATSVGVVSGPIATLLDSNYAILNQLKVNMQHCRVHENTELLMRYRDNILSILNHMNNMGGVMAQMPPLPVRMNVELANNFLPKPGSMYTGSGWGGGGSGGGRTGARSKRGEKERGRREVKTEGE